MTGVAAQRARYKLSLNPCAQPEQGCENEGQCSLDSGRQWHKSTDTGNSTDTGAGGANENRAGEL